MSMLWQHKEEWWHRSDKFLVVVKRHAVDHVREGDSEGPHRWNVYAYLYPSHPHFAAFSGPDIFQDAANAMPLHGGCTFLQYHRDEEKVTSVQVGCDYHHLHDDQYTHYATPQDAWSIFHDAGELFAWLLQEPTP